MRDLPREICNAAKIVNNRFCPEAIAHVMGFSETGRIAVFFRGAMCLSCGMSDYFVDLLYILEDITVESFVIEDMLELDDGAGWIVIYSKGRISGHKGGLKWIIIGSKA